jgi:tripartite-type tricarboxylate transporter receptor subunit TctC
VAQHLNFELVKAIKSPEFKKKPDELMLHPGGNTSQEFSQHIKTMSDKVGRVIQNAKIKAE